MGYFFVSYMHDNAEFVKELDDKLAKAGISVWTDSYLHTGDDWKIQIDLHIEDSAGVILVVTPSALASPYVTYEWSYAKGLDKPVIPLLLEKVDDHVLRLVNLKSNEVRHKRVLAMHPRLADIQYISFLEPSDSAWEKLIADLKNLVKGSIPSELKRYWDELDSSEPEVRKKALEMLRDWDDPEATEVLAKAVEEKKLQDVREKAALTLARRTNGTDERALDGFDALIMRSRDSQADYALRITGNFSSRKALELIRKALLHHEDTGKQRLAAEIVGDREISSFADILLSLLAEEGDSNVRLEAAKSLAKLNDSRVVEGIVELVSPWVSSEWTTTAATLLEPFVSILMGFGNVGIDAALGLLRHSPQPPSNSYVIKALQKADRQVVVEHAEKRSATASTKPERRFWEDTVLREFRE